MAREDESLWVFRDRYPERNEVYARMDAEADSARETLRCDLGIAYGDHPREAFDLFPGPPGAPLVVFIHGGYWQGLLRERFAFVARPLVKAGYSVALPGYPLAPEARLSEMVYAVDRSVDAILKIAARHKFNPSGWIASGHSAGGHLALLTALRDREVPLNGVVAISPICDLESLRDTSLDAALGLTDDDILRFSPRRQPAPRAPVQLVVGADETAGFRGQALTYAARLVTEGGTCSYRELPGLNHYTIPLEIERPYSSIMAAFNELTGPPARQGG